MSLPPMLVLSESLLDQLNTRMSVLIDSLTLRPAYQERDGEEDTDRQHSGGKGGSRDPSPAATPSLCRRWLMS